ncbi:DNA-processing protein DprA [Danxiaibacter flavus]|uniref:DNA-processing protein DprA n=1 Tax=Danxiaibacter flavus TaxID=3049108 RepID=A0ABV3ZG47_9BACT|nr:DNA-processing protein DprA [Chitinophagaceae bacterium DXS]
MTGNLLYQIALTLVPNIGCVQAKILMEHFGDVTEVFRASFKELSSIEKIGEIRAKSIKSFDDFNVAENEIEFIEKYKIEPLFITDKEYPQRLLHCYDCPTLLYYKGNTDLNASKIISVIGTRHHTDYGKQLTEKFISDLQDHHVLVVSGLAFGIDGIAHKSSLSNNLSTIGVLAHGLDIIYPAQHTSLAKEMILHGGILTEHRRACKPDKHNFPKRNRIVAGMADATIVIETALKGGSMITAELANNYNRDVFAFPGKTTDLKSTGCNHLIRSNKAMLIQSASEVIEMMGWEQRKKKTVQRQLFVDVTDEERMLIQILQEKEEVHIDTLYQETGLSSSSVAAAILAMELKGMLATLPGKRYRLI